MVGKKDKPEGEWAKFWLRGGTQHLHAHYVTHAFTPHTHEEYVFAVVGAGAEAFRYRGAVHRISPGFVGLVNPGEVHTGYADAAGGWLYRTLYPSVEVIVRAAQSFSGDARAPYFSQVVVYDPHLAALVRCYHRRSEFESALAVEEALLELTAYAVTRYADGRFSAVREGREPEAVQQVRGFLEAHPQDDVTLGELGVLTGLSPYALLRAFRRHTGLTPHGYRVQRRVEVAKARLLKGEAVAVVATDTGFYDQSHFGKHFKRIVGVTPRVFAKGAISS